MFAHTHEGGYEVLRGFRGDVVVQVLDLMGQFKVSWIDRPRVKRELPPIRKRASSSLIQIESRLHNKLKSVITTIPKRFRQQCQR